MKYNYSSHRDQKTSEITRCLLVSSRQTIRRGNRRSFVAKTLQGLRHWLAEALEFTIGNPAEERHLPPPIGPQPYRDKPHKVHG